MLNSRELIQAIISRKPVPRCGFWLGNPHPETWPIFHASFGTKTEEELRLRLGDDFCWITPQYFESTFKQAAGEPFFELWRGKKSHSQHGPLAGCVSVRQVEEFDWPDPASLNFEECIRELRDAEGFYRASGFWAPFFHDLMDLFGMENYLVKMHTHPEVVQAATGKVCTFYLEANERFYQEARSLVDGFFFGNDFGTQHGLIISPSHEALLPDVPPQNVLAMAEAARE